MKKPKILEKALEKFRKDWGSSYVYSAFPESSKSFFIDGWKARQEYEKKKRANYKPPYYGID